MRQGGSDFCRASLAAESSEQAAGGPVTAGAAYTAADAAMVPGLPKRGGFTRQ